MFSLNCKSLSLNVLRIYFLFCYLETPSSSCPPCSWPTAYYHLFLLFSDLFSALIIAFPLFLLSKNKTCMVLSRISIGTYSMFSPYLYESFTKYPSHLLPVMLPGNSFGFLSTIVVPYYTARLISTLFLTYFHHYCCFSLVSPF